MTSIGSPLSMAIVTGDRYLERLFRFVEEKAGPLIDGSLMLKLNPAGIHYVQSRLEALHELESLLAGAPVDYLRAYVSDLGDHRALEQLRRILRLLTSLKVVSVLSSPTRDPTPLSLLPFGRLKFLELRGCDLSTSAAKGLLELRHTLEKIICHNSTDALRHVFTSRIVDIKDCPQWNRLSFVSCACNSLVLMDESLQLLPAVETLDLSRNKFAKVDNLRKCSKLKHLDLGFNHLRAISSFSEVFCHIVKLVLRNNALTTLRGIENLKSLEGLDVSYNIISNFSELEFLSGLTSLQSLWLEGNPLCCSRWFRPHVFSYFSFTEKLKLDDEEMTTREFWKRQFIIASRQKRPASFGFYFPAKSDAKREGSINRRKKKVSRLAWIEGEDGSTYMCSDHDSVSIDNEIQSREETVIIDDEAEIVDLINRVELMKKEHSVLWLREFKEWMDHASEDLTDESKCIRETLHPGRESLTKTKTNWRHGEESSASVSGYFPASRDESSTNVLESDSFFMDMSTGLHGIAGMGRTDLKENLKVYLHEKISSVSVQAKGFYSDISAYLGQRISQNVNISTFRAIDDVSESHSSSAYPGSPPHYQEDILHRRHCLEEEILQLSAESYSMASSDSNTSCSEDDMCSKVPLLSNADQLPHELNRLVMGNSCPYVFEEYYDRNCQLPHPIENDFIADSCRTETSTTLKLKNSEHSVTSCSKENQIDSENGEFTHFINLENGMLEKRKGRRKAKSRLVSLEEYDYLFAGTETSLKSMNVDFDGKKIEDQQQNKASHGCDFRERVVEEQVLASTYRTTMDEDAHIPGDKCSYLQSDDLIEKYFNTNVADLSNQEIYEQHTCCHCIIEMDSLCMEKEVAILLSSKKKIYVLLLGVGTADDKSGASVSLLGCHKVECIKEILVGVGLQVVRVYIEGNATYLFITRSIEKSTQLFNTLQVTVPYGLSDKCDLRSLEQGQVDLFEKQICGISKVSILQYSIVLFLCNNIKGEAWVSRSLFIVGVHLLVCIEDFKKFGSLLGDASLNPYFSLDSCCCISDISEMVVEANESQCVTITLKNATLVFNPSSKAYKEFKGTDKRNTCSGFITWKLKWYSEDSLLKFVALVKAIHPGTTMCPLLVRCT